MAQANIRAVITAEDRASGVLSGVGGSLGKLAGAFAAGQIAANLLAGAVSKITDAVSDSVGAAFDQVRQVENASFALRAYEKDASKVNKVLTELVEFARSDMGTLFKREELFKAASNLRAFGVQSDQITEKVKILARGVSLGMTTFDELSQIIGRVIQRGRINAEEFDMLAQRGIVLDTSFRGAAVSSEQLFTELSRVLPSDLLQGRANTIDGMMIKLQSSFRDLGSEILGVDKSTSTFIEGGLGDRAMKALVAFTEYLKKPETKQAISDLAVFLGYVANALVKVGQLVSWVGGAITQMSYDATTSFLVVTGWVNSAAAAIQSFGYNVYNTVEGARRAIVNSFASAWGFVRNSVMDAYNFIRGINWGALISGIGKGIGNGLVGMLEGAINGALSGLPGGLKVRLPRFASGVQNFSGGMAVVGEQGPELVQLPQGSNVVPNHRMGGAASTTVNISLNVGVYAGSEIEKRKLAKDLFSSLQEVANQRNTTVAAMVGA
jgi:hypothetical protein